MSLNKRPLKISAAETNKHRRLRREGSEPGRRLPPELGFTCAPHPANPRARPEGQTCRAVTFPRREGQHEGDSGTLCPDTSLRNQPTVLLPPPEAGGHRAGESSPGGQGPSADSTRSESSRPSGSRGALRIVPGGLSSPGSGAEAQAS